MAIGIFDSGVGGLTVFSSVAKAFSDTDIYYLGDTARVPYGNRSEDTIITYSLECADYLVNNFRIDALVVACNTASSFAMDAVRERFDLPVIGVVRPGAEKALRVTKSGRIAVIGTRATVRSASYAKMLKSLAAERDIEVVQKACPLFVPLVEEMLVDGEIADKAVRMYLDGLINSGADTLILGCTHYPVLKPLIQKIYPEINIVDSSEVVVENISELNIFQREEGVRKIFVTDESPAFDTLKNVLAGGCSAEKAKLGPLRVL